MGKHALVHKTGKLLKCHVCLTVFDGSDHKREHEDIHTKGGKHYTCQEPLNDGTKCESNYSAKGSLCMHIRNAHHNWGLSKAKFTRKPDAELVYESLNEYKQKIKKSQVSTSKYSILDQ